MVKHSNSCIEHLDKDAFKNRLLFLVNKISNGNSTDFAKRAEINDRTFKKYLNDSMPGADKLFQIAQAGDVSVDWLLTGRDSNRAQLEPVLHPTVKQAIDDVKVIMESDHNTIKPALMANLSAFRSSVETESGLKKDVDNLKQEVEALKRDPSGTGD